MYSVQGQEMVDVVFEGIPDCFCLDGTVVVKSSTKGPALPKKPCAGHGGWALTSDSTQELTVNCKNQDCSIYDGFVLGFSDMPKVVNAKNAPQAHSIVIRTILLQEPKSVQDFKEIAEDMMMQQRKISKGLVDLLLTSFSLFGGMKGSVMMILMKGSVKELMSAARMVWTTLVLYMPLRLLPLEQKSKSSPSSHKEVVVFYLSPLKMELLVMVASSTPLTYLNGFVTPWDCSEKRTISMN